MEGIVIGVGDDKSVKVKMYITLLIKHHCHWLIILLKAKWDNIYSATRRSESGHTKSGRSDYFLFYFFLEERVACDAYYWKGSVWSLVGGRPLSFCFWSSPYSFLLIFTFTSFHFIYYYYFFYSVFHYAMYFIHSFIFLFYYLIKGEGVGTSKPLGHWTEKNMRLFFEHFAKSRNLDPLLPDTWYHISPEDITKEKVFNYYWLIN